MIRRFLFINANWYSFLSASLLSTSVNLFTGIVGGNTLLERWPPIALSTFLSMVAAIFWGIIAWQLDAIQRMIISRRPSFIDDSEAWEAVLTSDVIRRFRSRLIIATFVTLLAFAILPISITLPPASSIANTTGNPATPVQLRPIPTTSSAVEIQSPVQFKLNLAPRVPASTEPAPAR